MTIGELLKNPLFIFTVATLVSIISAMLGLVFKQVVMSAISELKATVKRVSDDMQGHGNKLTEFEVEIKNLKDEQEGTEKSTATLAKAVQKMLIALPTNYCTKEDLVSSTNKISDKLDSIDRRLSDTPRREEIDRRLAELYKS